MNDFKFFNVNRIYNELFYQFPKVLIASDKYKKMSDSTKIAYMLLKARLEFAVKKNQVDENGNVYFTFTINELGKVLDCGKQKVLAIKSQLEEYGLLYQKQMGFNKQLGKNNPNRLYLAELDVTENDIYQLQSFDETMRENIDKSEGMKIIPTFQEKTNAGSLDNQEGMKIIPCQNVDKSEGMKISTIFNNISLDTLDTLDTKKEELQQQLLLDQFPEVQENTFLNKDSLKFIATFSNTIQEAHEQVGTIIRAKIKAEKDYNVVLIGEDYQEEIDQCLRRVMHKIKTDSTVKSPKGLFYKSFYNLFVECAIEKKNQLNSNKIENLPEITTHNWV
ncbi:replication protein RepA [Enterococcus faecalis]|uniref:replication initiator protein A n=1 Tax=Enterococcus TaxID=1350 RepID=UPI000C763C7B|nr:replication initiator protein A [Enterococcus faecalis]EGO8395826.1 replication initiator protein A [Enterococcus faecalis]EKJ5046722.1 replication initiator protein A [Enterococcus faecalis]EKZ0100113.1 replication initiator protein A [Enterococcus faecalis]MCB8509297.1 replication initiator protein A [Enterococcus faecalis]PLA81753.1 replication protein RepA [Enterococcus faecalis]